MRAQALMALGLAFSAGVAEAKVKTEVIEYKQGSTVLEGYLAYDDALTADPKAKMPAVLVVHEWMGLNDYAKRRARELAELGYVAFAADIYGKGVRPSTPKEAGEVASSYKNDRNLLRARVNAGFDTMLKQAHVDASKTAAMGYCFGGTTVLELARSGAPVSGVISFHGGLDTPTPADAAHIKGKVLALHGADDPFVPKEQVEAFEAEMRAANVDWQLQAFGGAVHGFTNPDNGNDNKKGAAYNERADQRSFASMKTFFKEVFGAKSIKGS